ncbi:MAG: peroxidase-related enzyme [Alphaproteobacteria bacterium]|nr:peroxidase-related enzyme [Alphaproteobacteria bacterium]
MSDQAQDRFPISRFGVPALEELPDDLREKIEEIAEKSGFVPNVFMALARRPDELRAFFAYYDALMTREGGLSKAEKEMIVVATSAANRCPYCVVSHGALLRIFSKNPLLGEQVAVLYEKADISERQRAMLDAAMVLAKDPGAFGEADIDKLKAAGFSEDDVWDIGAITAFFALSNRMAHLTDMRPNDEFYLMGRLPREKG